MRILVSETTWSTLGLSFNLRDAGLLVSAVKSVGDAICQARVGQQELIVLGQGARTEGRMRCARSPALCRKHRST